MNSITDGKTFQIFSERGKTKQFVVFAKISQPQNQLAKIWQHKNQLAKISQPQMHLAKNFTNHLCLAKTL